MNAKSPRITREARSQANDEAIRQALLAEITEKGWDSVAVSTIAKRAGVSVGAIYARAENLSELGNQLWIDVLAAPMHKFFIGVIDALRSQQPEVFIALSETM